MYLLVLFVFSCSAPDSHTKKVLTSSDTTDALPIGSEHNSMEEEPAIEEQSLKNSLNAEKVLTDAIKIAMQNREKNYFYTKYETVSENDIKVATEIRIGHHFTKLYPHLLIRRNDSYGIYIDVYTWNKNKFEKVISHEQSIFTYVNDTIWDVDGDGSKDFIVNWYAAAGCCLKGFSNVYRLKADQKTFSSRFEFINPTFSPNEKIIRGICYGHPGETEMYKYRWNNGQVDTIEYISYEKNMKGEKTGKIIVLTQRPGDETRTLIQRIDYVPVEYTRINDYDWFTGLHYK